MAVPTPGAGRKAGLSWMILVAALAVPGILFYNWWSHMKVQREQSMAAKARGRIPEGALFQATPNPSKLVNPMASPSSSSTVAVVEAAAEAGAVHAAVTAPAADSTSAPEAPLASTKIAAAAETASTPGLKRDPMISPFDALRLKEEDARKRSAQDQLHRYSRPRAGRTVESSIEVLGIISGPGGAPKAIVNNDVVGVGQRIGGVRVVRITDTSVTFEYKGKKFTKSVGP